MFINLELNLAILTIQIIPCGVFRWSMQLTPDCRVLESNQAMYLAIGKAQIRLYRNLLINEESCCPLLRNAKRHFEDI